MTNLNIRRPAVAGMFYPADSSILQKDILQYLAEAEQHNFSGRVIRGLVAPHAGYMFSGRVAASAYRQLENHSYDSVIIISPSHINAFNYCSIFPGNAYQTPLGQIEIDKDLADKIIDSGQSITYDEIGHKYEYTRGEHALEIQLPFLQLVLKNVFKLVPIVMGHQSSEIINDLAESLFQVSNTRNTLIIASSDLSHFHPQNEAHTRDKRILELFEKFDTEALERGFIDNTLEACGGGPMTAMMKSLQKTGIAKSHILSYATSGDIQEGDKKSVVGYMSGVITLPKGSNNGKSH